MLTTIFCVLAVATVMVHGKVGTRCHVESECDAGECCQILSEFMVVSKRDLQKLPLPTAVLKPVERSGTCQKYHLIGENCGSFEKINGYCGCQPGSTCHTYEVPLPTVQAPTGAINHVIRSMLAPHPGYQWVSKCEIVV